MSTTSPLTTTIEARRPADSSRPERFSTTTEQLLVRRNALPAGHPERAVLRDRVIERSLGMADQLARRYSGRGELFDDLAQVAAMALVKAVDGYDASRGIPFAGYAIPCILGALKRHFRDTAWGMHVPRSTQELARKIADATSELSQAQGHTPTSAELAGHLRVSVDDLLFARSARHAYHPASLTAPSIAGNTVDPADHIGSPDPGYANVDDQLSLAPLLAALAPRDQRIMSLRFYGEMSQTRIAAEVGLSQMQVSRVLKHCLAELRAGMPAQ